MIDTFQDVGALRWRKASGLLDLLSLGVPVTNDRGRVRAMVCKNQLLMRRLEMTEIADLDAEQITSFGVVIGLCTMSSRKRAHPRGVVREAFGASISTANH